MESDDQKPIDGQIDIGELFVRGEGDEENEQNQSDTEPIEGQMSIGDYQGEEQVLNNNLPPQQEDTTAAIDDDALDTGGTEDDGLEENATTQDDEGLSDFFKDPEEENKTKLENRDLKDFFKEDAKDSEPKSQEDTLQEFFEERQIEKIKKQRQTKPKNKGSSSDSAFATVEDIKESEMKDDDTFDDDFEVLGKDDDSEYDGLIQTSFEDDFEGGLTEAPETSKAKPNKSQKPIDNSQYFENDENAAIRNQVKSMNAGFEEVNKVVGHSVFADVESSTGPKSRVDIEEKVYSENSGEKLEDGLLLKNLDTVLHESMIPYSEHVILDRALPRVEDGLKPVQRRILYTMLELGVTPDKPFRKSARIVGDCLGKFHPHGDSSVYDAMVRLAQPFSCNEVLVSGHGNFGSVDGDSAAAMRYTEARLAPLAMELLRDLDKNTVKWGLNFDDTTKEPEILPGRFPNLLVNGTSGIAVGLATNIPPHNLGECIDGVVAYIDNPKITLKEMLKIIKGPDFPTGGYILDNSEIYQAYETGRGKVYMRAKMYVEGAGTDKRSIIITDLPYQVNKAALLQKIAGFKDEGKYDLDGIAEIRDESDRDGQRAVIRLKKDASLNKIYNSLLKNTELQCTFGINMVAIAGGKPKQMGLLDIISYYSEYQREIILRRSKYDLEQAKEREHILTGLIIAIKNIDAVVKIIKTSQNTTEAKKRLKEKFVLSDKQAQAILDMRLARLTSLEVNKLEEEIKKLRALIKELTAIVGSTRKQYEIVKNELLQIKRQYRRDRRTKYLKADTKIHTEEEENVETTKEIVVVKSALENFKAIPLKQYNLAQKDFKDTSTLNDVHILKTLITSSSNILGFTSKGNCIKISVKSMGECRYKDKGQTEWSAFKELDKEEHIVAVFDEKVVQGKGNILFLTKCGMIKKTALSEYNLMKKNFQAMKLKDDDEILTVTLEPDKKYTAMFVTRDGMLLNAKTDDVPLQGRVSGGVKGMAFTGEDYCIMAQICTDGEGEVLTVTNKGYCKRVICAKQEESVRYRKGLKLLPTSKDAGNKYVFASIVREEQTLCVVEPDGDMRFKSTELVPIETRNDKGKPFDKAIKNMLTLEKAYLAQI